MSDLIKIAVDAMGGDGSPKKIIDGIIHNHQSNKEVKYKIFGDQNKISEIIKDKIDKDLSDFGSMLQSSFADVKSDFKNNSDANTKKAMDFVSKMGSFKKHSNPKPEK